MISDWLNNHTKHFFRVVNPLFIWYSVYRPNFDSQAEGEQYYFSEEERSLSNDQLKIWNFTDDQYRTAFIYYNFDFLRQSRQRWK